MIKIVAFSGSTRKESFNTKLVKIAASGAESAGAEVRFIDFLDYPMPLFNQDDEAKSGMPANVRKFKQALIDSHGFLVASPEYNSSYSPLLKNAIDWASRSESKDEKPLSAYGGKAVSLMAASPGNLGGLRGLMVLRMLFGNLGMIVLPRQVAIGSADQLFNGQGQLTDDKKNQSIFNLGVELVEFLQKIKS